MNASAKSETALTLPVKSLHCSGCAARVSMTLEEQPGVNSASVDLKNGTVDVLFDATATTTEALAAALATEGYTLVLHSDR